MLNEQSRQRNFFDTSRDDLLQVLNQLDNMTIADQIALFDFLSSYALNFYRERYNSDFLNKRS